MSGISSFCDQPAISIKDLSFTYQGRNTPTLKDISLEVHQGDIILVCGHTGCGKSTLLSCINGLIPFESNGTLSGDIRLFGQKVSGGPQTIFPTVATVFQNPSNQLVTGRVCDEVAFTLENLCYPPEGMDTRIDEALSFVGLSEKKASRVTELSGGEKQRLAIAAALVADPKILLLDEPVSQLDPEGAQSILKVVAKVSMLNKIAVVLVEHRLPQILSLANRVVKMRHGKVIFNGTPEEFSSFENGNPAEHPVINFDFLKRATSVPKTGSGSSLPMIRLRDVSFSYEKDKKPCLKDINLSMFSGEKIAITGRNGSGKSTLLKLMAGIIKPASGTIEINIPDVPHRLKTTLLLQDPDLMLFKFTVREELSFAPENLGMDKASNNRVVNGAITGLGLKGLEDEPPFSLSAGQRLRVALGALLTGRPAVLLLDEPTTGQDQRNLYFILEQLLDAADLVVMSTHDHEMARHFATRILTMDNGVIKPAN